jgi:hypothetical protein
MEGRRRRLFQEKRLARFLIRRAKINANLLKFRGLENGVAIPAETLEPFSSDTYSD